MSYFSRNLFAPHVNRLFPVMTYPVLRLLGVQKPIPAVEGWKAGFHPVLVTSSLRGHIERKRVKNLKQAAQLVNLNI